MRRVRELLESALGAAGVTGTYGRPLGRGVAIASDRVAILLALAHERLRGSPAVAYLDGQVLQFGGDTSAAARVATIGSADELAAEVLAAAAARRADPSTTLRLTLDLDLDAPAPPAAHAPGDPPVWSVWEPPEGDVVERLAAAQTLACLVGPGVLRARAEAGLRALAAVTSLGVLNTWGAKGVFYWESRHHLATVGLQADDFRLGGLADSDLILTCGLDARESHPACWQLAPWVDVAPAALGPLSERLARPWKPIDLPPIRQRLAAVTVRGYERRTGRPAPSALTRDYARLVGPSGLVAADPGVAGFFVARTLPTQGAGTSYVPAEREADDIALAACLVARLRDPERRCVAVIDGPSREGTSEVLDVARSLGVALHVERWEPGGPAAPVEALERALVDGTGTPCVREVGYDARQLDEFVDVAGPVVAWGGIGGGRT